MKRTALLLAIGIAAVLLLALAALRWPAQKAEPVVDARGDHASPAGVPVRQPKSSLEPASLSSAGADERTALPLDPGSPLDLGVVAEEEGTPVRITVRAARNKKSALVPGIRVIVGMGKGIVKWRGSPLTDVTVLGEGKSDEEGSLKVTIDIPRVDAHGNPLEGYTLFAQVDEHGYQKQLSGCAIPALEESVDSAPIELLVVAQRGVTLFGRVLRSTGEPASHGRVRVFREKDDGKTDYNQNIKVSVSRDGRFMANLHETGRWHVHVRSKNLGAFGIRDFEVVDGSSENLVLRLEGPGVLAGHVFDLAGQPIPSYQLWAVPGDRPDDYVGYYHDPVSLPHEWKGGTFDGHTTTNEKGEFRFAGLQEGAYFIRGTQATSGYYDAKLTLAPVATGRTDLELSLPRHCILLTVRDESGVRLLAKKMHYPKWTPLSSPVFYVKKSDGEGRILKPHVPEEGRVGWLKNGQHAIEVLPDEHYVVGVFGPQHALREKEVHVPFGEFAVPVAVVLPPTAEPGTLRIEVQSSAGVPMTSNTRVEIRSRAGLVLFKSDRISRSSTHQLKLPPGSYTCHVSDIVGRGHHGERIGRQEHSPVIVEAHVESAQELFLPVRLAGAGRIRVLANLERQGDEPLPQGLRIELQLIPSLDYSRSGRSST